MKYLKQLLFTLTIIMFSAQALAAKANFELIKPSAYKPDNLLTSRRDIEIGLYQLNLRVNFSEIFLEQDINHSRVYIILPALCEITHSNTPFDVKRRTDFSIFVFNIKDDSAVNISVSIRNNKQQSTDKFNFVIKADNNRGDELTYSQQPDSIYLKIINSIKY